MPEQHRIHKGYYHCTTLGRPCNFRKQDKKSGIKLCVNPNSCPGKEPISLAQLERSKKRHRMPY